MCPQLEAALENLQGTGCDKYPISPQTPPLPLGYNCIAYAAGHTDGPWWPNLNKLYFWPDHLPRQSPGTETRENFIKAFEWKSYRLCKDGNHRRGIEKVAIFLKDNRPTHAARQLESGRWTSKCGSLEDIEHARLADVEGSVYGKAAIFLHRRIDGKPFLKDRMKTWAKRIFLRR